MKTYIKSLCVAVGLACSVSLVVATIGCSGDRYHRSTGVYLDDKAISTKVKTDLLTDPGVKGHQVRVRTYEGKVQLSGFVDTLSQKDRAAEIARRVKGVQWVKNDILVRTALPGSAAGASTSSATNGMSSPQIIK